ncbi:hypothetical protein B0H13DRAFT_1902868 [Mycena leptocephala]|nr:hypothetical protein B0H13DRAFT_1902868 [Mycena leptocephala]
MGAFFRFGCVTPPFLSSLLAFRSARLISLSLPTLVLPHDLGGWEALSTRRTYSFFRRWTIVHRLGMRRVRVLLICCWTNARPERGADERERAHDGGVLSEEDVCGGACVRDGDADVSRRRCIAALTPSIGARVDWIHAMDVQIRWVRRTMRTRLWACGCGRARRRMRGGLGSVMGDVRVGYLYVVPVYRPFLRACGRWNLQRRMGIDVADVWLFFRAGCGLALGRLMRDPPSTAPLCFASEYPGDIHPILSLRVDAKRSPAGGKLQISAPNLFPH